MKLILTRKETKIDEDGIWYGKRRPATKKKKKIRLGVGAISVLSVMLSIEFVVYLYKPTFFFILKEEREKGGFCPRLQGRDQKKKRIFLPNPCFSLALPFALGFTPLLLAFVLGSIEQLNPFPSPPIPHPGKRKSDGGKKGRLAKMFSDDKSSVNFRFFLFSSSPFNASFSI